MEDLATEELSTFKTIFDLVIVEITLTQEGLKRYTEVLSIVDYYLSEAQKWCREKSLSLFEETKTCADLSFTNAYRVPDPMDNVVELATQMIF